jgi:molybdate transport system substrate-binding protein
MEKLLHIFGLQVIALLLGLLVLTPSAAETLRVAVASNFSTTLEALAKDFEQRSSHELILASGSTGKHYAQIINGAPFDLFFAADVRRPKLLERQQHAVAHSRFTYAIGKLVLWSARTGYVDPAGEILSSDDYRRLAIANPRLAPYGQAAREVLQRRKLFKSVQPRLVRGENIAQTYQFIASGNAELGFIALSQLHRPDREITGSWWIVPEEFYSPIEQQAVLLRDTPAAQEFVAYIKSNPARQIIRTYGYAVPGDHHDQ